MEAVCFACGHEKKGPLLSCPKCQVKPLSRRDRLASMCLSTRCLPEKQLRVGAEFIKTKGKIPGFSENVVKKATELLNAVQGTSSSEDVSTSFEFSESFFDFDGKLRSDLDPKVTVHVLGKPAELKADERGGNLWNSRKTYHTLTWRVGKEISEDDYEAHRSADGEIYVWYRWIGNRWTWKYVSKSEFERLRKLEAG